MSAYRKGDVELVDIAMACWLSLDMFLLWKREIDALLGWLRLTWYRLNTFKHFFL